MRSINSTSIVTPQTASVLVVYERSKDSLILTMRAPNLTIHPGEICFPGGRWQPGDENLYATALRELSEELGIASSRVTLHKAMAPVQTLTGFIIHPWFASITSLTPYHLDLNEVAEVITLPMEDVKLLKNYQNITVTRNGLNFQSCQYIASSHFIWGATARIMKQLAQV